MSSLTSQPQSLFLKKGWRNRLLKRKPASSLSPCKTPLYTLIQAQNDQEACLLSSNPFKTNPKTPGKCLEKAENGAFDQKNDENRPKKAEKRVFLSFKNPRSFLYRAKPPPNLPKPFETPPEPAQNLENKPKGALSGPKTSESKPKSPILSPLPLSYRDRIRTLEDAIDSERRLSQSLQALRFTRAAKADALLSSARKHEKQRISSVLEDIRLRNGGDEALHQEISGLFDRFSEIRLEIERNFDVFKGSPGVRNIEFFEEFGGLYRREGDCRHGKREGRGREGKIRGREAFFSVKVQRIDSYKSKVTVSVDKNKEISFVTAENTENFIKFSAERDELVYFGNNDHDQRLLNEFENTLLRDLELQRSRTKHLINESLSSPNETPKFRPSPSHPPDISIFLRLFHPDPCESGCPVCRDINNGLGEVFRRFLKYDRALEPEIDAIDQLMAEVSRTGDLGDWVSKAGEGFRKGLISCFRLLPCHGLLFEKCFKMLGLAWELTVMRHQTTVALLMAENKRFL